MTAKGSFLEFVQFPRKPGRLTSVWAVSSGGPCLGSISWFSPWRRYVFYPAGASVLFDAACLREVADFCDSETSARKKAPKAKEPAA